MFNYMRTKSEPEYEYDPQPSCGNYMGIMSTFVWNSTGWAMMIRLPVLMITVRDTGTGLGTMGHLVLARILKGRAGTAAMAIKAWSNLPLLSDECEISQVNSS
jgi:hypothetical protein